MLRNPMTRKDFQISQTKPKNQTRLLYPPGEYVPRTQISCTHLYIILNESKSSDTHFQIFPQNQKSVITIYKNTKGKKRFKTTQQPLPNSQAKVRICQYPNPYVPKE
ncbi:hypothetical protein CIPAW_15G010100 [Carya illinoinensis]|uniref:Uncharacterized protein n=1 Tax=Carya illinoinensis TaxID=32201 RepID=A0A8T1N8R3_CARIL|nr:hypothetical protein CIPAW_15G010100 [Carya illinoinensis]